MSAGHPCAGGSGGEGRFIMARRDISPNLNATSEFLYLLIPIIFYTVNEYRQVVYVVVNVHNDRTA